jgi:hypothetical protein
MIFFEIYMKIKVISKYNESAFLEKQTKQISMPCG